MNICPSCKGKPFGYGIACTTDEGCKTVPYTCDICGGAGAVDDARLAAWNRGREMQRARLDAGRTMRDEAARLGIKPSELSRRERGLSDGGRS